MIIPSVSRSFQHAARSVKSEEKHSYHDLFSSWLRSAGWLRKGKLIKATAKSSKMFPAIQIWIVKIAGGAQREKSGSVESWHVGDSIPGRFGVGKPSRIRELLRRHASSSIPVDICIVRSILLLS